MSDGCQATTYMRTQKQILFRIQKLMLFHQICNKAYYYGTAFTELLQELKNTVRALSLCPRRPSDFSLVDVMRHLKCL